MKTPLASKNCSENLLPANVHCPDILSWNKLRQKTYNSKRQEFNNHPNFPCFLVVCLCFTYAAYISISHCVCQFFFTLNILPCIIYTLFVCLVHINIFYCTWQIILYGLYLKICNIIVYWIR